MSDPSSSGHSPLQVISISCGSSHSAALLNGGLVVCYGRGEDGQLGNGNSSNQLEPVCVAALVDKDVTSVECGAEYTVALCSPSTSQNEPNLYSWGW